MKPHFYLLALTSLFFCFSCEDDNDATEEDIRIRLVNSTPTDLELTLLSFYEMDAPGNFGYLAPGDTSDYLSYESAGSCDFVFTAHYALINTTDSIYYAAQCECICPLEPGNYVAQVLDPGGIPITTVVIEEE